MDDLGLLGWVIPICVVLAATIISIFQTRDRWRTNSRERLREALVRLGRMHKRHHIGSPMSDDRRAPQASGGLTEEGPKPSPKPVDFESFHEEHACSPDEARVWRAVAAFSVIELFEKAHPPVEQLDHLMETLTRLLKFDTESILFAPGQDSLLMPFSKGVDWMKHHGAEDLRHLVRQLEDLYQANNGFEVVHESTTHVHFLAAAFPGAGEHIPSAALAIPALTIAIVALKETILLFEEKTTIDRAFQHIVVQAGSIAVCGFAGKKIGIWIGFSLGHVPGAIVGAFVGSVIGALTGKRVSNAINGADFERAREQYERDFWHHKETVKDAVAAAQRNEKRQRDLLAHECGLKIHESREQLCEHLAQLASRRNSDLQNFCASFPQTLDDIRKWQLRAEHRYLRAIRPSWIEWIFGASLRTRVTKHVQRTFERAGRQLDEVARQYAGLASEQRWEFIRRWALEVDVACAPLTWRLREVHAGLAESAEQAREQIERRQHDEKGLVAHAESKLRDFRQEACVNLQKAIEPTAAKLLASKEAMIREARPLGYAL